MLLEKGPKLLQIQLLLHPSRNTPQTGFQNGELVASEIQFQKTALTQIRKPVNSHKIPVQRLIQLLLNLSPMQVILTEAGKKSLIRGILLKIGNRLRNIFQLRHFLKLLIRQTPPFHGFNLCYNRAVSHQVSHMLTPLSFP